MSKKSKSLKYRDLPLELKNRVNFTYGHVQKAQNPTMKHILNRLKKYEKIYIEEGAEFSAQEKREAIDKLEQYMESASL